MKQVCASSFEKPCQPSGATQFFLLWECEEQRCGCPHDPSKQHVFVGSGPGGLNRCFRQRLNTGDMVAAPPSAAGTHQVSTDTVSIPPLCHHPVVSPSAFFTRSVVEQGRVSSPGAVLIQLFEYEPIFTRLVVIIS